MKYPQRERRQAATKNQSEPLLADLKIAAASKFD
jgi:hypothetical protein